MKAIFENIVLSNHQSFSVQEYRLDYFDSPWHFHPEYELTFIKTGYGTRFVGDHAEPFKSGDLVLIGANVPHYWRSHEVFYENRGLESHSIVIQFKEDLFFKQILPEMQSIHALLRKSASGIFFSEKEKYKDFTYSLLKSKGFDRLIMLYQLLYELSNDQNYKTLSISQESQMYQARDSHIFQQVIHYIFENIREEISLSEISHQVNMSTPAFCRYFKKRTKMTFTEYVNKIRILRASQHLLETDLNISQICYANGFNSLSYFNRQFKKYRLMSPKDYRSRFQSV